MHRSGSSGHRREQSTGEDVINCLSIDVEGFLDSNLESFGLGRDYPIDSRQERHEIERNMEVALEVLDASGVQATFFFLGTVTSKLPDLVRRVAAGGHEVASHSYEHTRLFGVDPATFRVRLAASKEELEQLAGSAVLGFRAPEFSITKATTWAIDIIAELGFAYDSSIYPIGLHDVYGIPSAERRPHVLTNGLVEFPLATMKVLVKARPVGGGGYFRLYPLRLTMAALRSLNRAGAPAMLYLHPYEIGPVIPRVSSLSPFRRFRHYYGWSRGKEKLERLFRSFQFAPAIEVLRDACLVPDVA
jgi:polysaccharide deacetylase family protein (PEP-CTERM system associated)